MSTYLFHHVPCYFEYLFKKKLQISYFKQSFCFKKIFFLFQYDFCLRFLYSNQENTKFYTVCLGYEKISLNKISSTD